MECDKKGDLKIHIAVNVKSKKILSIMKVTDEHVRDSKALPELVDKIARSDNVTTIGKLFTDGAYDGNDTFRNLSDNGILPCINYERIARVRLKTGHFVRNLSVLVQKNDIKKWKDSIVSYGHRCMAETVFWCIKRTFGKYVIL